MSKLVIFVASAALLSGAADARAQGAPPSFVVVVERADAHAPRSSDVGTRRDAFPYAPRTDARYRMNTLLAARDSSGSKAWLPPGVAGLVVGGLLGGAIGHLASSGACESSNCGASMHRDTNAGIFIGAGVGFVADVAAHVARSR